MKRWLHGALVVYLAALAFGVLTPHPPPIPLDPKATPLTPDGLLADAIRNLALLIPFGGLLAALGRGAPLATLLGFLLSLAIEAAQTLVPGRFPSGVDIVANTLGAAAGALLYGIRRSALTPDAVTASRVAHGCGAAVAVGFVAALQLLRLSPGGPGFDAGWRPELGQFEPYAGAIESAQIGTLALPIGALADGQAFVEAYLGEQPIRLRAELRQSGGAMAPLLTVHDRDEDEILVVAAAGADLILEQRTRAIDLGFDQPVHRWADGLADAPRPGDQTAAALARPGGGTSTAAALLRFDRSAMGAELSIAGRSLGERVWTPGRVWGLLIPGRIVSAELESPLDALTIALLALPCAYYARRTWLVAVGLALLLVLLPQVGPVAMPRAPEWFGLAAGMFVAPIARVVCAKIVVLTPQSRQPDVLDEELQ